MARAFAGLKGPRFHRAEICRQDALRQTGLYKSRSAIGEQMAKGVCRAQHATTPARESGALGAPVLCPNRHSGAATLKRGPSLRSRARKDSRERQIRARLRSG